MPRAPWVDVAETQSGKGNTQIEQREASNTDYRGGAAHYREPRHSSVADALDRDGVRQSKAAAAQQAAYVKGLRDAGAAVAAAGGGGAAGVRSAASAEAAIDALVQARMGGYQHHHGRAAVAAGRTARLHENDYADPRAGVSVDRAAIAHNRAEMDVVGRAPRLVALPGSSGIAARGHGIQHAKKGGLVRGKRGAAVPIVAHGGELVVPQPMVAKVLRSSAWMAHVAEVRKKNGVSMKEAMKIAKGSYRS